MTAPDAAGHDPFQLNLDAQALKSASITGSLLLGSAQILRAFLQVASQVVLARLLFPSDFGLIAMVYPIINFAAIFSVGFGETIVQRPQLRQDQVSALFWLSTAVTCGVTLIVMAIAPLAALAYGEPRLTLLMIVVASFMPISALAGVQGALLTRHMRFKTIVAIDVAIMLVGAAVTVLTALMGWSYWSLAAGNFALTVVGALLNWHASKWRPSRPRYVATVWDDLKFGSNITGYNLATFLTTSGDSLIIGMSLGERALGLYDRSYRLVVQPVGQIIGPIGRVATPLLSRLVDDAAEYRRVFLNIVQIIIVMTVPGMLVCIVHGPEVVAVLLGPRWTEAGPLLSWISVSGLTSGLQATALWLFISQARMRGLRRMTIYTSLLNLTSFAVGAFWGILGVAIAVGLTFSLVTTPIIMYGATRRGPVSPKALLRACAPFAGAGVIAAALLVAIRNAGSMSDFIGVLVALIVAYAIFAGTVLMLPKERRMLFAMIRMGRDALQARR